MIQWSSPREARFDASATGNDAVAIHRALTDWLKKVLNEVGKIDGSEWDVLVFEHGCTTGTVTSWLHKHDAANQDQPELAVCMRIKSWQRAYDSLPQDEENVDKWQKAYKRMLKTQVDSVKRAINDPQLKSHFLKLKNRATFTIYSAGEDELQWVDCWQFLWGNRPPRREFANSRELFDHLCRKAHLYPEGNVRGRGNKVTGVTWFGESFSDEQVDFLESVPNVSKLCSHLKNLRVEHTRVTAEGVDRLRTLLPNANVKVVGGR